MKLFQSMVAPWILFLLFVSLAPTGALAAAPVDRSNSPPNTLDDRALVRALRDGGHVIYFRHGKTDLTTHDTDRSNLARCATQRQLSVQGRQEMEQIGQVFRRLDIQVGAVISSPYCRAAESVKLAFNKVTLDADLTHTVVADEGQARRQAMALRRLLATAPAPGSNMVLGGHTANLQEATGIWPSPEGVAIVFRPDGKGGFDYVATVPPDRWSALPALDRPAGPAVRPAR